MLDPGFHEPVFRVLFSSIFSGLGGEHIVSDKLIQNLMPAWVPAPRMFSVLAGMLLLIGGTMILLGVCFLLYNCTPGPYSLTVIFASAQ